MSGNAGDGSRATPGNRGGRQLLLLLGIATIATLALLRGAVLLVPELLPSTDWCEVVSTGALATGEQPTAPTPRLHFLERWPFRGYRCPLHSMTGIACPSCGGTRALVSLVRGELARSLRWNPLVILGALGLPLLAGWAGLAPGRYAALTTRTGRWLRTWPGRLFLIAIIIAQMVYGTLFLAWIGSGGGGV